MIRALLRRLGDLAITAFGVSVLTFAMIRLIPGDAVQTVLGANADVGAAQIESVRTQLGLDRSMPVQYAHWLWRAVHGDLGTSLWTGRPVLEEILPRIGVTAEITLLALFAAGVVAVPLGRWMAVMQRGDAVVRVLSVIGITAPSFWLGTMLLYGVATLGPQLQLVGWIAFSDDPIGNLQRCVLPVTALALPVLAALSRVVRASMIEVMHQDYIRTARSKGTSEHTIVSRHAWPNAMLPFLTSFGITAGYLFGGSVVVEQVFALPGLGRLMVGAIAERNYPLVQASILLATLAFVMVNAAVDLLYAATDPRIRRV